MADKTIPPLDTWLTEEKTVEVTVPDFTVDQAGNPRLQGIRTEKQTRQERVAYTQPVPIHLCSKGEHFYAFLNGGRRDNGRLLVKCQYCPIGQVFVIGIHQLINGKITKSSA